MRVTMPKYLLSAAAGLFVIDPAIGQTSNTVDFRMICSAAQDHLTVTNNSPVPVPRGTPIHYVYIFPAVAGSSSSWTTYSSDLYLELPRNGSINVPIYPPRKPVTSCSASFTYQARTLEPKRLSPLQRR
jgi:hypothetical protein